MAARSCRPRFWVLVVCLYLVSFVAPAEIRSNWSLRVWQSDEGLPDNSIVGIAQTADGFLWIATQGGLVRFDGLQFHESRAANESGAPSGLLRALCVDGQDRLWMAKERGVLVSLERGLATALTTHEGLPLMRARSLACDSQNGLWMAFNGRMVVRVYGGQLQALTVEQGLPGDDHCQIAADLMGRVWFIGGGKLGLLERGRFEPLADVPDGKCVAPARSGGVWLCSGSRVMKFSKEGQLSIVGELAGTGPRPTPTAILEDQTGNLWVGTSEAGLFRFDGTGFQSVHTSHQEISCLAEDSEGSLWVGTMGGGLNRLRRGVVELQEIGAGPPFAGLRSLCRDSSGRIWVVNRNGEIFRNSGEGWRLFSTNEGWSIPEASSIAAEPKGGVWIGTQRYGLHLWREKIQRSLERADGLAGNIVRSLLVGPDGVVWIGTTGEDLQCWNDGRFTSFLLPFGSGTIGAMSLGAEGELWAGSSKGILVCVRNGILQNLTPKSTAASHAIRSLCLAADGSLWIGYAGAGVGCLKSGRFSLFQTSHGLNDDYISQILEDAQRRLWFAGNRGIFFVYQKDFYEVDAGRTPRVYPVSFGRDEGLPALPAIWDFFPGALRTPEDELLIALKTGLAVVHPEALERFSKPPPVVIESVLVDDQEVAAYDAPIGTGSPSVISLVRRTEKLVVPARHQQVTFNFTAPSQASPRNETFRYKLEGMDQGWLDAGNRRAAYYPHLPPGSYTFRVVACNARGVWNEPGASFQFETAPHTWETAWFKTLTLALGGGVLTGVAYVIARRRYRYRLLLSEQQRALERERTRIAQDLHDDLGAGLVEISFGSELAQDPTLKLDEAREHTREIGTRARELVTALDEIVWAINPKHDTVTSLATYFCQYTQHFLKHTRMHCHLDVPGELPLIQVLAEQRHNLFLAFKEALSNVVQHSRATDLWLAIFLQDGRLLVEIADNGSGFDGNEAQKIGSDGLDNMKSRLEQIGGFCTVTSNAGQGTRVRLELPLPVKTNRKVDL